MDLEVKKYTKWNVNANLKNIKNINKFMKLSTKEIKIRKVYNIKK